MARPYIDIYSVVLNFARLIQVPAQIELTFTAVQLLGWKSSHTCNIQITLHLTAVLQLRS